MIYEKYLIGLFIFTWVCVIIYAAAKSLITYYHNSKMTVNTCLMREFFHGIEKLADPRLKDGLDDKMDEIRKQCFPRK